VDARWLPLDNRALGGVCACYGQGRFGKLTAIEFMDLIERTIRVNWQHRVVLADDFFNPTHPALRSGHPVNRSASAGAQPVEARDERF